MISRYHKYQQGYKAYYQANKARIIARNKITQRIRNFGADWEQVFIRDNYACVDCGMTLAEHLATYDHDLNIDHIDGDRTNNSLDNLQTLCMGCHGVKDIRRRIIRPVKGTI